MNPKSSPKKRTTLADVAKEAGVSGASVSYALNNSRLAKHMNAQTKERIRKAAERLGYRANDSARSMATGKTRTIAFLGVKSALRFEAAQLLVGASLQAETLRHNVQFIPIDYDTTYSNAFFEDLLARRFAGMITFNLPRPFHEKLYDSLKSENVHLAQVAYSFPDKGSIAVISDVQQGTSLIIDHLKTHGHQRIAVLANANRDYVPAASIGRNLLETAKKQNLTINAHHFREVSFSRESVQVQTQKLLKLKRPPTAICCENDPSAMTAITTAQKLGLRVPEDISITGYSDLHACHFFQPSITTIEQPTEKFGEQAAKMIVHSLKEKTPFEEKQIHTLPVKLLVRESTGPVP